MPDHERPKRSPRFPAFPYTDPETKRLVDQAVAALVGLRAPAWPGDDPGPKLSVLAVLALEADGLLYDAVADAVDHGYSWGQVASRLNTTTATARRRYSSYARWRSDDDGRPGSSR